MTRKPSCLISCSHRPPEGSVSAFVGRHGSMKPAGRALIRNMAVYRAHPAVESNHPDRGRRPARVSACVGRPATWAHGQSRWGSWGTAKGGPIGFPEKFPGSLERHRVEQVYEPISTSYIV